MLALGFTGFLLFGVVLVLVGASQDALATTLALDLSQSGLAAAVLALCIGAGMLGAGPLVDRLPRRPLFAGSTLLAGSALVTVGADMSFGRLLVHLALLGVGGGMYDVLLNVVAVERFGARAARRVTFLHAAATAGAVVGPGLVYALGRLGDWTTSFHATGWAYFAFTLWVLAVPLDAPAPRPARTSARGGPRVVTSSLVGLLLVAFAYLGVETGVTIFAVPYANDGLGLGADRGRAAISAFWFGLLLGRLALIAYPGRLDARLLCAAGAAGGLLLLAGVASGSAEVELCFGAAGFALGGVFPLMVTLTAQGAPPGAVGLATGLVAGLGSLGGFAIPWLAGALGDAAGIRAALALLAVWCLAIAAAALFVWRVRSHEASVALSSARG